jgi:hypothetical protein
MIPSSKPNPIEDHAAQVVDPATSCSALHDTEHRDCIVCPHCGHEMDDSEAWGYPDVEWDQPGQCPVCEGEFQWSRFISVTYTTTPNNALSKTHEI